MFAFTRKLFRAPVFRICRFFHGAKCILFTLALAGTLSATKINYSPAQMTTAGWSNCANFAGQLCKTTAHFDAEALSKQNDEGVSDLFQLAFDAWKKTADGKGWTDPISDKDLGGKFNVKVAKAEQFDGDGCNNVVADNVVCGGLEIRVFLKGVKLPKLGDDDQLVWAQGLFDNYDTSGGITANTFEMDIISAGCTPDGPDTWCPPAYAYQYPDHHFYDRPTATYHPPLTTQAFFDANAYLAVENTKTKTLTLYDGISYGFQNYVTPEPGAWILVASGLVIVLLCRRRACSGC